MSRLDQAIKLAVEVHEGQVDKGGNPYILHPLRAMCAVEKDLRSGSGEYKEDYLCAAICHDVVEDFSEDLFSRLFIEERIQELGRSVHRAVISLTRERNESWENYINKVYENPIARLVKIHDLEDNCDLSRLEEITREDKNRNKMYIRAKNYLETGQGKL